MLGTMILAGLLLLHLWPFSRPAVLIPLGWWAMFLINRRRVSAPVLGLIQNAAEKAGYWPVPAHPALTPKPAIAAPAAPATPEMPVDDEDGELSVA
jgi:hypothetical protein